jgi:hypothetical protein
LDHALVALALSEGGGPLTMRHIARIVGSIEACGGQSSAISMAQIPSDHTSTGVSHSPSEIISGDIHRGEPMTVPARPVGDGAPPALCRPSSSSRRHATPKSAILTSPQSESSRLPHLMSR